MHESTQRLICRAAFAVCCALPTLLVFAWIFYRILPGAEESLSLQLSAAAGLEVEIASVAYPQPGRTLLTEVRLCDPESHRLLAKIRVVEAVWRDGELALLASQPEIEPDGLPAIWRAVEERLLRSEVQAPVKMVAAEATLQSRDERKAVTLRDLMLRLTATPRGTELDADFRLVGEEFPESLRLAARRNRQVEPAVTEIEFHTAGNDVPVRLLAPWWPAVAGLGDRARLRGSVWSTLPAEGFDASAALRLREVELDRLIGERFAHRLTGVAEIAIDAKWSQGRLTEANGEIQAGPGAIGRSLVKACVTHLGWKGADWIEKNPGDNLYYRQLALRYQLDSKGLAIFGNCREAGEGVIVTDSRGEILRHGSSAAAPLVSIVRAFVPASEVQVPATAETDSLLRWLPLPPAIRPKSEATATRPQVRVRLDEGAELKR